jgi:hypothetical protein
MEHRWNEFDRGKPKYSGGKTCPSATLTTTNPTWTDPGSNLGLCGGRPATNRLSHGTTMCVLFVEFTYHLVYTFVFLSSFLFFVMEFNDGHKCVIINKLEHYEWMHLFKRLH